MLASSSGVSSERTAFMDLVKTEIDRLNESIGKSGSVTMIFQRGNIRVRLSPAWKQEAQQGANLSSYPDPLTQILLVSSVNRSHDCLSPAPNLLIGNLSCACRAIHFTVTPTHCVSRRMCFRVAMLAQVEKPAEVQEIIGQKRLRDKVSGILERIEKELDSVESKIGESMHVLDTDNDGMVGAQALQSAMRAGSLWPWQDASLCALPLASRQEQL